MLHVDAINAPEFPHRMVFVEFLEMIGRLAFDLFKDHEKMRSEPLHLKIDALLTKMFKVVKYPKAFTFLEPARQNIVFEVVLNPQLGLIDKTGSTGSIDVDSAVSIKLNL